MKVVVNVKWNKEIYKDVEVDLEEPPEAFKIQIMSLTGVPIERQKVIGKGGMLQNEAWGKVTIKQGMTVMVMGTADEAMIPAKVEEPQFVEDLPEQEQDAVDTRQYGAGLENLGNTCYMNACLQCFYRVPELKEAFASPAGASSSQPLTREASKMFAQMAKGVTVIPGSFWGALRMAVPQFDQMGNAKSAGGYRVHAQQDAEECWTALLTQWRQGLQAGGSDIVKDLFQVQMETVLQCTETEEQASETTQAFNIKCNVTSEINHMNDGIRLALTEDREKHSESLGRTAQWSGKATLSALPAYLTVQIMRFYYKVATQQRAKIMRRVSYSHQLDMFEFCSDKLQAQLRGPRRAYSEITDAKAGITAKAEPAGDAAAGAQDADGDSHMEGNGRDYTGELTGRYDLIAVLTHKGRSLDAGHYVAWCKQDDGSWVQFDDDKMIPRKDEDILELSGGGDWHTGYLFLYKPQRVPESSNQAEPLNEATSS